MQEDAVFLLGLLWLLILLASMSFRSGIELLTIDAVTALVALSLLLPDWGFPPAVHGMLVLVMTAVFLGYQVFAAAPPERWKWDLLLVTSSAVVGLVGILPSRGSEPVEMDLVSGWSDSLIFAVTSVVFLSMATRFPSWLMATVWESRPEQRLKLARNARLSLPGVQAYLEEELQRDWESGLRDVRQVLRFTAQRSSVCSALSNWIARQDPATWHARWLDLWNGGDELRHLLVAKSGPVLGRKVLGFFRQPTEFERVCEELRTYAKADSLGLEIFAGISSARHQEVSHESSSQNGAALRELRLLARSVRELEDARTLTDLETWVAEVELDGLSEPIQRPDLVEALKELRCLVNQVRGFGSLSQQERQEVLVRLSRLQQRQDHGEFGARRAFDRAFSILSRKAL